MEEDSKTFEASLQSLLSLLEEDDNRQRSKDLDRAGHVDNHSFGEIYHFCKDICEHVEEYNFGQFEKYRKFLKKVLDCKVSFAKLLIELAFRRDAVHVGVGSTVTSSSKEKRYHGYVTCCLYLVVSVKKSIMWLLAEEEDQKSRGVHQQVSSRVANSQLPLAGRCLLEMTPILYEIAVQLFGMLDKVSLSIERGDIFEDYEWGPSDQLRLPAIPSYSFAQQRTLLMTMLLSSISKYDEAITAYIMRDIHSALRMIDVLKTIILTGGLKNASANEDSKPPVPTRILDRACRCLRRLAKSNSDILQSNAKLVEELILIGLESKQYEVFYALQVAPDCAKVALKPLSKHLLSLLRLPIRSQFDNTNIYDDVPEPQPVDWGIGRVLAVFSKMLVQSAEHYKTFMQNFALSDVKSIFISLAQRWFIFRSVNNKTIEDSTISQYEEIITNFSTLFPTLAFPLVHKGFISEYQDENMSPDMFLIRLMGIAGTSTEPGNAAEVMIRHLLTALRSNKELSGAILPEIQRLQYLLSNQTCIISNLTAIKRFHVSHTKLVKSIIDTANNK